MHKSGFTPTIVGFTCLLDPLSLSLMNVCVCLVWDNKKPPMVAPKSIFNFLMLLEEICWTIHRGC